MAKGDIVSIKYRLPTDEESDVADWFEKQESESVNNIEAGARQIIALITAFYGLIFGVLAFGADKFEASLERPWVIGLGALAVVLFLAGLGAALAVVIPRRYEYREASLDDMQAAYHKITGHKSDWLRVAMLCFGLGLAAFAALILGILLARL
jgi:uncharacterized membrane protein